MVHGGCWINMLGVALSVILTALGLGSVYSFFGLMTLVGLGNGMTIPNATAGSLSVRPHLAGTAAGLSGSIMLGLGAALSALAGAVLPDGSGPLPLLIVMLITAVAALISILMVIRRERNLKL